MKIIFNFSKCLPTLVMALLGCLVCNYAWAYDFSAKNGANVEIYYSINPDGKSVTVTYGSNKYQCDSISIPQEVHYEGSTYTVTAIGTRAFNESRIRGVALPNTVEEIQSEAFYESNLKYLTYSSNLKYIRKRAFAESQLMTGVFPDNLSLIEESAFSKTKLVTLHLPVSLTKIGKLAFSECPNITSVVIPGSIKEVEPLTFSKCNKLEKVIFEEGVEIVGNSAFSQCKINSLTIPSTIKKLDDRSFHSNYLTNLVLPKTIEEIGKACFSDSYQLESISFPDGLESLPEDICKECPKLIKVIIPEGVKSIGKEAFKSTPMLSHITLPESVTEIGDGVFQSSGIVNFTFPKNLQYISTQMFSGCTSLLEIIIPENIKQIGNRAFSYCIHLRKALLPEALESVGSSVFSDCSSLEEINIPSNLKNLGDRILYGCASLTSIAIPEGVEEIGNSSFENCTNLTSLQLPKSLMNIRGDFIRGCNELKDLTIYHNVSGMSQTTFHGCNLEELHYHRAVLPKWIQTTNPSSPIIDKDNNCTLFVPVGSVDTYKESPEWNVFYSIVGEEVTEMLNYQISFPTSIVGGNLMVNGETPQTLMEYPMGSKVEITPISKDGYHLKALLLNGKVVTADMINGSYVIENLDANYIVEVDFDENPVKLSLFIGEGGSIDVEIEKGRTFSCSVAPEKEWQINTVTFNGKDVTEEVIANNQYTTPNLTRDSELRVTFEMFNGVEGINATIPSAKVYLDELGNVIIEGLEAGTPISVYSVEGMLIDSLKSCGERDLVKLSQGGIYLIQTPVKTYKLHY